MARMSSARSSSAARTASAPSDSSSSLSPWSPRTSACSRARSSPSCSTNASQNGGSSYDLFGGLFRQMATAEPARGGRFEDVTLQWRPLRRRRPIELKTPKPTRSTKPPAERLGQGEAGNLRHALPAKHGDGKSPARAMSATPLARTSPASPISRRSSVPPSSAVARAHRRRRQRPSETPRRARGSAQFRVLDPACGSGNFLFVAYREMKRLERDLLVAPARQANGQSGSSSRISLHQFFGHRRAPFAVELAKVTLMLAKELEIAKPRIRAKAKNSSSRKRRCRSTTSTPISSAPTLSSPMAGSRRHHRQPALSRLALPRKGARLRLREQSLRTLSRRPRRWPTSASLVPARARSLATRWTRRTCRHQDDSAKRKPRGQPRLHRREWRHDHRSRLASGLERRSSGACLDRQLGEEVSSRAQSASCTQTGDSVDSPWEKFEEPRINPTAFRRSADVSGARLDANEKPKTCLQWPESRSTRFLPHARRSGRDDPADARNREVVFPYMIGRDLVEDYGPTRWIIDFAKRDQFAARSYALPSARARTRHARCHRACGSREEGTGEGSHRARQHGRALVAILRLSTGHHRRYQQRSRAASPVRTVRNARSLIH